MIVTLLAATVLASTPAPAAYPQRVGYRLVHADSLAAFIDGTSDGQARKVEFPYRRVGCPNPR